MARYTGPQWKISRRLGFSILENVKELNRRAYAPGQHGQKRKKTIEVGGLTVTLKDDGSSMEKVLSSILSLPELLDCYDNDILFTFRGLLNEQAGANIRNEIAHGIISVYACSTGVCLYF